MWSAGKGLEAILPVLTQHSSAAAGTLAWQGIIAAATVLTKCADPTGLHSSTTSNAISSSHVQLAAAHASGVATNIPGVSGLAANSPSAAADVGTPPPSAAAPATGLKVDSPSQSFLPSLPAVLAYYSCGAAPVALAAVPHDIVAAGKKTDKHLQPVLSLLQADAILILPFIRALVLHCQESMGQAAISTTVAQTPLRVQHGLHSSDQGHTEELTAPEKSSEQAVEMLDHTAASSAVLCSNRLMAAVEVLLAVCQEQALLQHVLELLQPLHEACKQLRCAAWALVHLKGCWFTCLHSAEFKAATCSRLSLMHSVHAFPCLLLPEVCTPWLTGLI